MRRQMKDKSSTGATRNKIEELRYDLLVWEFIDEMAKVMAEGAKSHGEPGDDGHWRKGFDNEDRDIWNHVFNHQRQWREGDTSEPHLAKIAIGAMFQWYFDKEKTNELPYRFEHPVSNEDASPTFAGDGCDPQGHCGPEAIGITPSQYDSIRYATKSKSGPRPQTAEEILGVRSSDSKVYAGYNKDECANQRAEPEYLG
jgi:hypothetical protein